MPACTTGPRRPAGTRPCCSKPSGTPRGRDMPGRCRMRILHLSSLYPPEQVGGAELMVETLARTQAGLGHAVAVACASRQVEAPVRQDGVAVYRMGYGTPFHILDWPQRGRLDRLRYKLAAQWNRHSLVQLSQ